MVGVVYGTGPWWREGKSRTIRGLGGRERSENPTVERETRTYSRSIELRFEVRPLPRTSRETRGGVEGGGKSERFYMWEPSGGGHEDGYT